MKPRITVCLRDTLDRRTPEQLRRYDAILVSSATEAAMYRHSPAYADLIDRLADAEPNPGYAHAGQLELSHDELGTVLAEEPAILADAVDDDLARRIAGMLPAIDERPELILAGIGALVVEALRREARDAIYSDVLAECERREAERDMRTPREILADQAGVPAYGEL